MSRFAHVFWTFLILLVLLPAARSSEAANKEEERFLSQCKALEHRFERRDAIYHNAAMEAHFKYVVNPLLPATAIPNVDWRFLVLRDPMVLSFSLPDGAIYVSTGMLAVLENDDQLAGVLAHEIAHVVNGDFFRSQRAYESKETKRNVAVLGARWAPLLAGAAPWPASLSIDAGGLVARQVLTTSGGPIANFALAGYENEAERLADERASAALIQAQRDQAQLARSYELMAERGDPEPVVTFYTDSAQLRERAALVRRLSGGGSVAAKPNDTHGANSYMEAARGAIQENVLLALECRRFRHAVADAQRLALARPEDPQGLYLLGEAYRLLGPRSLELSASERSPERLRTAAKESAKRTPDEEESQLTKTAEGRETLRSNRQRAEEDYLRALAIDGRFAKAHLGLGLLFSQQGRFAEARNEYRQYLELAPAAPDRLRVEKRLAELDAPAAH